MAQLQAKPLVQIIDDARTSSCSTWHCRGAQGWRCSRCSKSGGPTREIPVITVSAYALLLLREGVRRADAVIQKPFDLADLLAKVRKAIDRTRVPA